MARTSWHVLLITAVASVVMFVNLGAPRLWDRDEPRNAACAREMMERDDWVVPTFNGELRVLKPAFKYWLMIIAYKLFGVSEFSARLGPALFAVATTLATYFLGRRLFNARVGLWSALILASSLLFVTAGHVAKADAPLTFFATLPMLIFAYGVFRPSATKSPIQHAEPLSTDQHIPTAMTAWFPKSWLVAVLFYAAVGAGALAKGLPGLLLPPAVVGMFLLIVRLPKTGDDANTSWWRYGLSLFRPFAPLHFLRTFWLMRPLTGFVVTMAVAAPWYVLVGLRTDGEFLRGFFLEHHLGRAMQPLENHSGPFLLYYLGTIALGFFPWSVFVPAVLPWLIAQVRQKQPWRMGCLLAACWVCVYVFIFSLAQTKLPSYITPCFPALALLMGAFVHELAEGVCVSPRMVRMGLVTLAVLGTAIAVGVGVAASIYLPGQEWLGLMGLILVGGSVAALLLLQRRRYVGGCVALAGAAVVFCATFFGIGLARLGHHEEHQALCAAIDNRSSNPQIGSFGNLQPSWVFYARRPIQPTYLNKAPTGIDAWKVKPVRVADFFNEPGNRFIITNDDDWKWLRPVLPADAKVLAESPRFLRKGRWLLVGQETTTATAQDNRQIVRD